MLSMSFVEIFQAGGFLMYPLAVAYLLTAALIVERALNLRESRILNQSVIDRVTDLVETGRPERAIQACRDSPSIFTNIVVAGLEIAGRGELRAKEAIEDAGRHETVKLKRYLNALGTIAAVAPLIGLLGTVTGMILVFRTIADSGGGQAAALSTGIFQALITTATGLSVAIPALIAHNFFQEKVEGIITELERVSLRALYGLYPARTEAIMAPVAEEIE
jgi:biopolymer transport protein ExbB